MKSFHLTSPDISFQIGHEDEKPQEKIDTYFKHVQSMHASDLHLSVGSPPIMRINGNLSPIVGEPPLNQSLIEGVLDKILNREQKELLEREKNIAFAKTFNANSRFKINIFFQKGAPSITFQFIPKINFSIDSLGLPASLKKIVKAPHGLIIITGPFDSGKSLTLTSIVNFINETEYRHIITLEDPIEYIIANKKSIVEQREIGKDTPNTVAALKFLRKEDVGIIVIGSLQGKSIIEQALTTVTSGRLVIAVMDSNFSIDCLKQIYGSFPLSEQEWARSILADNLLALINQRLVPKIGGGRALAYEYIINTPAVQNLISSAAFDNISRLIQTTSNQGVISLERYLSMMVKKGIVKLDDALNETQNKTLLQNLIKT